jgi:hypothetical protein
MKRFMTVLLLLPAAAFAADRPGQHFLLKPSDLPKPYATPAVANNDKDIPRPAGTKPEAPSGFMVSHLCNGFEFARFPAVAPNGDVFLSERLANKITLLRTPRAAARRTSASLSPMGCTIRPASRCMTVMCTSATRLRSGARPMSRAHPGRQAGAGD